MNMQIISRGGNKGFQRHEPIIHTQRDRPCRYLTLHKYLCLFVSIITLLISASCKLERTILVFPNNVTDEAVSLPYMQDFESGIFDNVQDLQPQRLWEIVDESGNKALKCVDIDLEIELSPGNSVFHLLIGDRDWRDYIFSFDCKIANDSWILFAPYADTNNHTDNNDVISDSRNPWSLKLDYNGILEYQTVFGHGAHYIGESSEKNDAEHSITPIDGFLVNEWNHVVLFPVGLEIHMKINENYIGKVADIQEGISGRASIGGYIGAMFDNLNVISSSAN